MLGIRCLTATGKSIEAPQETLAHSLGHRLGDQIVRDGGSSPVWGVSLLSSCIALETSGGCVSPDQCSPSGFRIMGSATAMNDLHQLPYEVPTYVLNFKVAFKQDILLSLRLISKRQAALPVGKTACLARLCMDQPITCGEKKESKLPALGALGPLALGVGLLSPGAPGTVQAECRMA